MISSTDSKVRTTLNVSKTDSGNERVKGKSPVGFLLFSGFNILVEEQEPEIRRTPER